MWLRGEEGPLRGSDALPRAGERRERTQIVMKSAFLSIVLRCQSDMRQGLQIRGMLNVDVVTLSSAS